MWTPARPVDGGLQSERPHQTGKNVGGTIKSERKRPSPNTCPFIHLLNASYKCCEARWYPCETNPVCARDLVTKHSRSFPSLFELPFLHFLQPMTHQSNCLYGAWAYVWKKMVQVEKICGFKINYRTKFQLLHCLSNDEIFKTRLYLTLKLKLE